SRQTLTYVAKLLPGYGSCWRLDYASFRPLEEQGRQLRLHARNDLIHVDSFPKRPTHGDRILRMFMNINPAAERHWITGEPLDVLADQMGPDFARCFLPAPRPSLWRRAAQLVSISKRGSRYDEAMRGIHQLMKENVQFQSSCRKQHSHFPPGSAWLVFTDSVPHAVVSGQYALEQTVIVPRSAMRSPDKSPAAVLERFEMPPRKAA
ncbi:MAG TPA: Kdo hydroxylase family protein, partial [Pirellulales bacterium]|nr:Kdo hydroxylase family protein [Pirellulales bacterium]